MTLPTNSPPFTYKSCVSLILSIEWCTKTNERGSHQAARSSLSWQSAFCEDESCVDGTPLPGFRLELDEHSGPSRDVWSALRPADGGHSRATLLVGHLDLHFVGEDVTYGSPGEGVQCNRCRVEETKPQLTSTDWQWTSFSEWWMAVLDQNVRQLHAYAWSVLLEWQNTYFANSLRVTVTRTQACMLLAYTGFN